MMIETIPEFLMTEVSQVTATTVECLMVDYTTHCGGQQISCDCNYKPPSIKKGLILRVLELNDGLCMDNKKEREKLADELLKAINSDLLLQTERNES